MVALITIAGPCSGFTHRWAQENPPVVFHTGETLPTGAVAQLIAIYSSTNPVIRPPPDLGKAEGIPNGWQVIDGTRISSGGNLFSMHLHVPSTDPYIFVRVFAAPSSGGHYSYDLPNPIASGGLWYADTAMGQLSSLSSDRADTFKFNITTSDWQFIALDMEQDSNADGLPDYWGWMYFNNPTNAAPDDDPDNDGKTNLEELISMTDPNDSNSYLLVESYGADGDGIQLQWFAYTNRIYHVEYAPLSGPDAMQFIPLISGITVDTDHLLQTNAAVSPTPNAYRLVVERP